MKLSDFELEVMQIMWTDGPMIATEVHQAIAEKRKVAYSTVKTIIDRLEEKERLEETEPTGAPSCMSRLSKRKTWPNQWFIPL